VVSGVELELDHVAYRGRGGVWGEGVSIAANLDLGDGCESGGHEEEC